MRTPWTSTNQKITALCVKQLEEKINKENPLLKRLYLTLWSLAKTPQAAAESDFLETVKEKQQLKKIVRGERKI